MSCEYNYYDENEKYYPKLYCKIDNKMCIYTKRCKIQERYIALDNQKECYKYNMEKQKSIPNGSKYILFERKGYLYIDMGEHTEKIKNTLGKIEQDYVYVKDGLDGYDISLTPFETKRTYTRKKLDDRT